MADAPKSGANGLSVYIGGRTMPCYRIVAAIASFRHVWSGLTLCAVICMSGGSALALTPAQTAPWFTPDHKERHRINVMGMTMRSNRPVNGGEITYIPWRVTELCKEFRTAPLAIDPPPSLAVLTVWHDHPDDEPCRSEELYLGGESGFNDVDDYHRPDIKAVRACAVLHVADVPELQSAFEGYQMLAILSANGEGVPQSWPAAMHYGCMAVQWGWRMTPLDRVFSSGSFDRQDAPLGGMGFVLAADRARASQTGIGNFDGCDNPIDDTQLNIREIADCAHFRERRAIAAVVMQSADRRSDQDIFNGATSAFYAMLVNDAVALWSMTVSLSRIVTNAAEDRKNYDALRHEIKARVYPVIDAVDLAASDDTLNRLYKDMRCELGACPQAPDPATADTAELFQQAERSWLSYRDEVVSAAVATALLSDQNKVKTAISAQLTKDRVAAFNRWITALEGDQTFSAEQLALVSRKRRHNDASAHR